MFCEKGEHGKSHDAEVDGIRHIHGADVNHCGGGQNGGQQEERYKWSE